MSFVGAIRARIPYAPHIAKIAAFTLMVVIAMPHRSLADDYAGCVAAYQRYNKNIDAFNARSEGQRGPYCDAIEPEVGYAACENFIRSGFGTPIQRDWATQVSDNLAGVYAKCQAQ